MFLNCSSVLVRVGFIQLSLLTHWWLNWIWQFAMRERNLYWCWKFNYTSNPLHSVDSIMLKYASISWLLFIYCYLYCINFPRPEIKVVDVAEQIDSWRSLCRLCTNHAWSRAKVNTVYVFHKYLQVNKKWTKCSTIWQYDLWLAGFEIKSAFLLHMDRNHGHH